MTKTLNLRNTKKLPITDDIRKVYDAAYAKKNRGEKYREVAKGISPWLNRLVSAYKERGVFPITPAILGDFYKDKDDKVIATIIGALCINTNDTDAIMQECEVMRREMGEHPYRDFFIGRQYTLMSLGDVQDKQIGNMGSMHYWQISKLVDSLWGYWNSFDGKSLEDLFKDMIVRDGLKPYNAFSTMLNMDFVRTPDYRINLALMALCDVDGISYRLWDLNGAVALLLPPMEKRVKNYTDGAGFMNILLPNCTRYGFTPTELTCILGLKKPTDLWYAFHAYNELRKKELRSVSKYMRRYHSMQRNYSIGANCRGQLKNLEPAITL